MLQGNTLCSACVILLIVDYRRGSASESLNSVWNRKKKGVKLSDFSYFPQKLLETFIIFRCLGANLMFLNPNYNLNLKTVCPSSGSPAVLRFEVLSSCLQVVQVVEAQRVFRMSVGISPWWRRSRLLLPGDGSRRQGARCCTLLLQEGHF